MSKRDSEIESKWYAHAKRYVNVRWLLLLTVIVPGVTTGVITEGFSEAIGRDILLGAGALFMNLLGYISLKTKRPGSYSRSIVRAFLVIDILLITFLIYIKGGIESRSIILYAVPILLSATFFGRTGLYLTTLGSIIAYNSLIVADYLGIITTVGSIYPDLRYDTDYVITTIAFFTGIIMVIAIIMDYSTKLIVKRELEARKLAQRLDAKNQRLLETQTALTKSLNELNDEKEYINRERLKDEAILSSIADGVIAMDISGNVILFNSAAETIVGIKAEKILNKDYKKFFDLMSIDDQVHSKSYIFYALHRKIPSKAKKSIMVSATGKKVPISHAISPIFDDHGALLGAIVVFRDITEEEALNNAKDEFVSITSHQLLTPLSSVGWYAEMLLEGDAGKLTKEQTEHVQEIYSSSQRMVELVDSFLVMSRLELNHNKSVRKRDIILKNVIDEISTDLALEIKRKQLAFRTVVVEHLPIIKADPDMLRVIVQNLLSNSVKYTPDGGSVAVSAEIKYHAQGTHKKYIVLTVHDTGIGIPADQHKRIFSKMFRADNVTGMPGTGLGLYIAKEAANRMGGTLHFHSKLGTGSVFTLEVPIS